MISKAVRNRWPCKASERDGMEMPRPRLTCPIRLIESGLRWLESNRTETASRLALQTCLTCSTSIPRAHTFVVISSFSFPSRNLFKTARRCSTVISPDNSATECPSAVIFVANHDADLRVWRETKCNSILRLSKLAEFRLVNSSFTTLVTRVSQQAPSSH